MMVMALKTGYEDGKDHYFAGFFLAKLQICLPLSYYVNGSFETMFCIQITFGLVRVQQKWSSFESNRMAK